ncbi:hypothetical protein [Helicobacter sp. 13S00401-1]|uniref:hypothetical protein n=1 Tax=Helicobacter sp. 13S00401-1 TaxID=1905758 RepID=UPI00209BC464|nr:hypothetical protein [Helicobacter sp. 13S00401-1]
MSDLNNISLDLYNKNTLYIKRQNIKSSNSEARAKSEGASLESASFKTKVESAPATKSTSNLAEVILDEKSIPRQTYGLNILELMSDKEYSAWIKATLNLNDGEKLLAAQKLYQLADMDKLREKSKLNKPETSHLESKTSLDSKNPNETDTPFIINANKLNGIKMFNAHNDFVQRYVNAYSNLEQNININS